MLSELWKGFINSGNHRLDKKNFLYFIPGLLLIILSFYADFKVLGLLLFLYVILIALFKGYKAAIFAFIIMLISGFISISRFGIDSWLMLGVQLGFAGLTGIGLGIFRDKYLKYVADYRLTHFGLDNANLMTFLFDGEGRITYVNQYVLDLLDYDHDELVGKRFDWLVDDEAEGLYMDCLRDKEYNSPFIFRVTLLKKDGTRFPVEVNCKYLAYDGKEYGFLFAQDITEILKREKDINFLLYRDSLTGLYNRRFFEEELMRLDTDRQIPIAMLMIDVNGLKVINDTYGHKAGDEHLKKVGDILKNSIRQEDILARWAGDEFVILMPNTDGEAARQLYQRIKSNCLLSNQNGEPISVAIGIGVKNESKVSINKVLEEADQDMYNDKALNCNTTGEHLIKNMLQELEEKSYETKKHIENVRRLSLELADRLGLSDEQKKNLKFISRLHDIGLTMLPDDLILKKGKLDKEDWRQFRKHPEYGSRIINSLRDYTEEAKNILSHHEWWNGQGYPEGLKGEEIPLYSRIIAIADAYDVMTAGRPYKPARSHKEAIKELRNYQGIQFDSRLVDEFIEMLEKDVDWNNINDNESGDGLNTAEINTGVELDYGDER